MAKAIEENIGEILSKQKKTISVAESCTGGLISSMITNVPGSSAYFIGGVVSYSNQSKMDILKVPEQIIQEEGAVSRDCAMALAQNIRSMLRTDIGIGVTGIAGPAGGSEIKPTGTVYIALSNGGRSMCKLFRFPGNRIDVKEKAAQNALKMLKEFLLQ